MSSVTASAPSPIVRRDFPGWLPPMLVKELRQGLQTRGFVGALVIFQLVMLVLMLTALAAQASLSPSAQRAGTAATTGFFWTIIGVQLLLVTPSRALGGLQQEIDARTLDLLMLTKLNAWRVVLGKWVSLLAQALLLLVAMLPYLVVRYFTDSADIVADLIRCAVLFGLSAVLTAGGLWASGIGKVLRVVVVILLVFGAQSIGIGFLNNLRIFAGSARVLGPSPLQRIMETPFDLVNAGLFTAYFLVSAVRNIAPAAENHSFFARILPVLGILAAPLAAMAGAHDLAVRQLMIAAGFLAFVLIFEFARPRWPQAAQWREWSRGAVARAVGRCSLPGWESALLYGVVATAIWAAGALLLMSTGTVTSQDWAFHAAWLALLGLAALAFPAILQSILRAVPAPPLVMYVCGLGLPVLFAGLGYVLAQTKWGITLVKALGEVLPVSSFVFAYNGHAPGATDPQPTYIVAFAGGFAVMVLVAGFWQSRPYWQQIALFDARERKERGLDA